MRKSLLLLVVLLFVGSFASAQVSNNTQLVGTITDPSGGVVSGAKITATNTGTQVQYEGTTNAEGYYTIPFVAPGTYDITVEQSGFAKTVSKGAIVILNQSARTDITLKVGDVASVVQVTADTPALSTDDALIGDTVERAKVENLPMNTRRVMDLATTASNVIIGPKTSFTGVPPGANYIGAGTREVANSLTLDGITIMNSLISSSPVTPNPDAISAVQVQSGNYTAQYGAYMGIHINSDTKSGTNSIHGTVYDYIQNDYFNAKPWLAAKGLRTPFMRFNQFGGVVSGPVVIPFLYNGRDKTFFMGSYEGLRQYQQISSVTTVPTLKMRTGDFSELLPSLQLYNPTNRTTPYANNQLPVSAVAAKLMQYYPNPTNSALTNNFNSYVPLTIEQNQTLNRVDHNIGQNVRLFGRFLWQKLTYVNGNAVATSSAYSPTSDRNGVIGYTHIITPTFINDLRVGFNTLTSDVNNQFAQNGQTSAGSALGIPGFTADVDNNNPGIPTMTVTGYAGLGSSGSNWKQDDRTVHAYDQISWTKGRHTIMAGADIRRMTIGRAAQNDPRGNFTFSGRYSTQCVATTDPTKPCANAVSGNGLADMVLGYAASIVTPTFQLKGSVGSWRNGYFVQDNWQVTPKLTLLYGMRYEQPTIPYSLNGYARILNSTYTALIPSSTATTGTAFTPTPGFQFTGANNNLWAPRLGFAYRATDKIVVRGGGGIYYNPNHLNAFTLASGNYPLANSTTYTADTYFSNKTFSNPSGGAAGAGGCNPNVAATYCNAFTDAASLPTPRMYQWNLDSGVELWKDAAFELQYLGSRSIHLDFSWQPNTPTPGPGTINSSRRPYQGFGTIRQITNGGWSTYNGLTSIFRQRLNHGLTANLSYTWAHNLDTSNDANGGGYLMNPYNIKADYGNSNWDIRHRFVGTLLYQFPNFAGHNYAVRTALGGWQANAIVTLQTGMPFNVGLSSDVANTGTSGIQRPNFVKRVANSCSGDFVVKNGTSASCLDATAYATPASFTYGNLHRNDAKGAGRELVNFSMFKNFQVYERLQFQFRAEAFNVLNHANPSNPNSSGNPQLGTASFGTITSTQTDPRVLQLVGKINF